MSGCFYFGAATFEDVVQHPPSQWSSRDCLTVIVSATMDNLSDKNAVIQVIATPYFPSVINAINQMQRTQNHWSENEAVAHEDELLKGALGLYADRENSALVNSKGMYLRNTTDIDSLLILLSLRNRSFPCNVPTVTMGGREVPLMRFSEWPCYIPEIIDLDSRIVLINDKGDTLHPRVVWGRRNNLLTMEETLFVMFPLRHGQHHFFMDSQKVFLCVLGFQHKLNFTLDLEKIR